MTKFTCRCYSSAEPLEPVYVAETAPPPPEPPAWLQRKVVVCVRDAATREDMTFQLLEDVRCLMTFEVRFRDASLLDRNLHEN